MDEKEKKSSKNSKETSDTKAKTTKKSTKKDESVIEKQVKVNGEPVSISVPNPAGDNQKDGMNINLTINLASEEKKKRTTSTTRKKPTKKKTTKKKKSKAKSKAKTKEKKKSRWWLLLLLLLLLLAVVFYFVYPHKHEFSADWVTDAENHWHKCTGCEEVSDKATHTYDNDCDSDCNVCGYVRVAPHSYGTTYENNETTHW